MKLLMVGQGAFGHKHLDALEKIDGVEVVSIVGGSEASTRDTAEKYNIPHWTLNLEEGLAQTGIEAAIIASPTPVHAEQGIAVMRAGKHVMIEIPMSDSLQDAQAICDVQTQTGLVAMAGHTRRFNPSHQWVHQRIVAGELKIQQMDVQTYFFRRKNLNALGQARSWTDHLLWHHACHTVDLFAWQTGEKIVDVQAMQGPIHDELGIAMDMSIILKSESGALCTLSLSFNNDGPLGTFFRYICNNGTYLARYDELLDGRDAPIDVTQVDVSVNGIEIQDREFISAIQEGREPNASVQQALSAMQVLDRLDKLLTCT